MKMLSAVRNQHQIVTGMLGQIGKYAMAENNWRPEIIKLQCTLEPHA
jgi:hypothetical protein